MISAMPRALHALFEALKSRQVHEMPEQSQSSHKFEQRSRTFISATGLADAMEIKFSLDRQETNFRS
jgi:hypothetical protein